MINRQRFEWIANEILIAAAIIPTKLPTATTAATSTTATTTATTKGNSFSAVACVSLLCFSPPLAKKQNTKKKKMKKKMMMMGRGGRRRRWRRRWWNWKQKKKEIDELPASREKQQDEPLRQPAITSSIAVSYANLLCKCLIIYARLHLPSIDPN